MVGRSNAEGRRGRVCSGRNRCGHHSTLLSLECEGGREREQQSENHGPRWVLPAREMKHVRHNFSFLEKSFWVPKDQPNTRLRPNSTATPHTPSAFGSARNTTPRTTSRKAGVVAGAIDRRTATDKYASWRMLRFSRRYKPPALRLSSTTSRFHSRPAASLIQSRAG